MRRATLGNLLNYSTTVAAQALFARRFGAGAAAAAYVIAFGLMAAVSGVFVTTIQSVVLPRLLDGAGDLYSASLKLMLRIGGGAVVVGIAVFALAGPLSVLLSQHTELNASTTDVLVRIAAVSAELTSSPDRWVPGASRGGNDSSRHLLRLSLTAVACALLIDSGIDVSGVFIAFAAGSVVQILILALSAGRSVRLVRSPLPGLNRYAIGMLLSTALLGFVAPFERVVAATHNAGDAARYDYAARKFRGSPVHHHGRGSPCRPRYLVPTLGEWTAGEIAAVHHYNRFGWGIDSSCGCVARSMRGWRRRSGSLSAWRFTPAYTHAVTLLLLIGLPGLFAQGIGIVLTSALSGTRHNSSVIAVGVANFVLRCSLIAILFQAYGVNWHCPRVFVVQRRANRRGYCHRDTCRPAASSGLASDWARCCSRCYNGPIGSTIRDSGLWPTCYSPRRRRSRSDCSACSIIVGYREAMGSLKSVATGR